MKKFDYRSISLDIFYPSFGDDPGQVARLLSLLGETETEGPLAKIERQRQRREAETKALRDTLRRGWFRSVFPVRWITLKVLLHFLHIYLRLREDQRFYLQKGLHAYRKVFLQIGRLLFPAEPEGIFFLTRAEIEEATRQEAPLSGLRIKIDERKHEFSRIQHSGCPPFLQGNAPYVSNQERQPGAGQAALRGIPVSAGKRTGRARIIAGPADLQRKARFIEPGDILVTKSTDPAWTPILLKLGGLVMETGGLLSHGAVIAREYGIPAVVGVPDAVQALREGELLEVDGSTGWVTRLG